MSDPVLELLNKKKLNFTVSGKDYLIKCLNPDHEDRNPSLRVDKITGMAHCFSCGFSANIFRFYGIFDNKVGIKTKVLLEKLRNLNILFNGVEFPGEEIPYNKVFRGISTKTLKKFGAFYCTNKEEFADRIYFPIKDLRGKTMVYVGRHILSDGNPRYLNYPRGAKVPVFPEVLESGTKSMVLVEGIFDLLNLYDKGLHNVICAFGVDTLKKEASMKLLPFKVQGITKIYLMFDGDDAGRKGMKELQPILEELEYEVECVYLEEGSDPGDLSQEYVDSIKAYINEKDNSNN